MPRDGHEAQLRYGSSFKTQDDGIQVVVTW